MMKENDKYFPGYYSLMRPFVANYKKLKYPTTDNLEIDLYNSLREDLRSYSSKWISESHIPLSFILEKPIASSSKYEIANWISKAQGNLVTNPKLEEELNLLFFYLSFKKLGGKIIDLEKLKLGFDSNMDQLVFDIPEGKKGKECFYIHFGDRAQIQFPFLAYKARHKIFYYEPKIHSEGAYVIIERRDKITLLKVLLVFLDTRVNMFGITSIENDFRMPVYDFNLEVPRTGILKASLTISDLWDSTEEEIEISFSKLMQVIKTPEHRTDSEGNQYSMIHDSLACIFKIINTKVKP